MPPTKEQARAELARRELARRQEGEIQQAGSKATGISNPPSQISQFIGGLQNLATKAPEAGQFAGSVVGGLGGARIGKPIRGQVFGATAGRAIGRLVESAARGEVGQLFTAEKKEVGKELLATAGTEAGVALLGRGLIGAGEGALKALLGDKVVERGLKVGFKKLLDPKNFQGRFPKEVAMKTNQFFTKLNNATGKSVSREVLKRKNRFISVKPIQEQANQLLKDQGADTVQDLGSAVTSKAQLKKVEAAKNLIDRMKQDKVSVVSLWKTRKELDKIRFGSRFDPDVERYLDGLRATLNDPIKSTHPDVAKAFGRYSAVKELEKDLGGKFRATLIDDEIFTPDTERFAANLLGSSKDEQIRVLQKLDSFLSASDKVVEDLLDVAAAESIEKPIQFVGSVGSRLATGAVGGRKAVAQIGAASQTPVAEIMRQLLGSGTSLGGTETIISQNR